MPVCGHPNCDHCGRNRHARKQSFGGRCEGPTRQRFERLLAGLGVKYELTPDGIYDTQTLTGVQTQVRVSDGMVSAYNKYTGDYVHYPMGKRGRGPRNIREFLKAVVNAEGNYNQRQADIALARAKYEAKLLKETELAQTKAKLKAETQAKEPAAENEQREHCARAPRNLAALEAQQPMATYDDKGEHDRAFADYSSESVVVHVADFRR